MFHVVYIAECISLTSDHVTSAEIHTQAKMSAHHTISLLQHGFVIALYFVRDVLGGLMCDFLSPTTPSV